MDEVGKKFKLHTHYLEAVVDIHRANRLHNLPPLVVVRLNFLTQTLSGV
jgi:hypothetical protein